MPWLSPTRAWCGPSQEDPGLLLGVNTYKGHITYQAVADSLGRPYKPFKELL